MQILINDLHQIHQPFPNPVLTIGNFDGVHLGHQSLFCKIQERSRAIRGTSTVMTFHPHPTTVLRPAKAPRQIIADESKAELIFRCGVEVLLLLPFSWEFAQIPARDFVKDILVDRIGMKEIVIGYDYTFGRKREGNIETLKELGADWGFAVYIHPPVMVKGQPVSSTRIRELILSGAMEEAKALLGRPFSLSGRVIPGKNIGRKVLGFPTANLEPREKLLPQRGVYVVRVDTESGAYYGVTNVGFNPTFSGKHISVETYLFDFDQTLYDQLITVYFLKRLRGEKAFSGPEALKAQIQKDIELARELLSKIE
jgi:riboflavin kinase/FMN adenylyltransferase